MARSYLNKILISCLAKNNNLLTPRYILKCFPHGGDQELINASVLCEIHDIFPGEKKNIQLLEQPECSHAIRDSAKVPYKSQLKGFACWMARFENRWNKVDYGQLDSGQSASSPVNYCSWGTLRRIRFVCITRQFYQNLQLNTICSD